MSTPDELIDPEIQRPVSAAAHDYCSSRRRAGGLLPEDRRKILYISASPLVPSKLGPARRNHHIVDQLSRFYDVSVLAIGRGVDREAFLQSCRRVSRCVFVPARHNTRLKSLLKAWQTARGRCDFLPALEPGLRNACRRWTASGAFDAIVLSSVLLGKLPLPPGVPVVADTHNVEFDVHRRTAVTADRLMRRLYAARQYTATREEERRCAMRADLLLATSDRDKHLFERELCLRCVEVVPNGIDVAEFQPVDAPPGPPAILFTGLMSYYPNQQGIRWFLDDVLPLVRRCAPDVRVVIAGAAPPRWLLARQSDYLQVTGQVADMRPYLAAATVLIAPLMIGGGTRVKILEAQAMARPVVSTTLGAEGLVQHHGQSILLADDAWSFASHVARLLRHPRTAARIAHCGRQHVLRYFNWDRIGERLQAVLEARIGLRTHAGDQRADRLSAVSRDRAL